MVTPRNKQSFAALPAEIMYMILDIILLDTIPAEYGSYYVSTGDPPPGDYDYLIESSTPGPSEAHEDNSFELAPSAPRRRHYYPQPVGFASCSQLSKKLVALSLVCRSAYPYAMRYLYEHCLNVNNLSKFAGLRQTLADHLPGINTGRNSCVDNLRRQADIIPYLQRLEIRFGRWGRQDGSVEETGGFRGLGDVLSGIGTTLKRLVIDIDVVGLGSRPPAQEQMGIFSEMLALEELVASYEVVQYFAVPPPNLLRLCILTPDMFSDALDFSSAISSLTTLVFLRPANLSSENIEMWFSAFTRQKSIDIVLVDEVYDHETPMNCRTWDEENDIVKIWETDIYPSWSGKLKKYEAGSEWCCNRPIIGDIWRFKKRQMADWNTWVREGRRKKTPSDVWGRVHECSFGHHGFGTQL